jgi:hypothetical protein
METFTCPACRMTSHIPDDVRHRYCGNCHASTGVCAAGLTLTSGRHGWTDPCPDLATEAMYIAEEPDEVLTVSLCARHMAELARLLSGLTRPRE